VSPFTLAASSEMLFTDLPHLERVRRIHALGFAVEIWDWTARDVDALADLARHEGVRFTSMTGYVTGRLADPAGADELLRTAERSVRVAHRLGGPLLNLHGTGLDARGLPVVPAHEVTGAMWLQAEKTLARIAELGRREGVTFVLENLNTAVDHPGVPFARAADVVTLVRAVDSTHLRAMLDLYHAQIGEGNLLELVRDAIDVVGEIQVADVPGRCEPGTGEINFPAVARTLAELGYDGTVGLEGWASTDSTEALGRFRTAFAAAAADLPPGRTPACDTRDGER
jgi:hydroxypyruvate isomerase